MAISGGGTGWDDPYIVDNWADYITITSSSYYAKFANPHEENGVITLDGSGRETDPYIVSTYEEMLFATQAKKIQKVKLVDRENKIYKYNDIWCKYDSSLSTINFETDADMPDGGYVSQKICYPRTDFNGWTFENCVVNNCSLRFYAPETSNLILKNFISKTTNNSTGIYMDQGVDRFIIDATIENNSSYSVGLFYISNKLTNSAVTLHGRGYGCSIAGSGKIKNTIFYLDINCDSRFYMSNVDFDTCIFTGDVKLATQNTSQLGGTIISCVLDFNTTNFTLTRSATSNMVSVYNTDKILTIGGSGDSNLKGVDTETLNSPQELYELGFVIGVG